jgi:DNA primase
LPSSPLSARAPKYYNSAETPLFSKSELLYGLEQAKQAGPAAGYLAVVEGYTDVLMAQQLGVPQVVSTMGTALNARHVRQLRRFVPRVVLVFDADAGGTTGVDRALEVFVGQDLELAVAALPAGLDPCDLLVGQGADAFRQVLDRAVDVFDFKLSQVWAAEAGKGVEGQRRAMDAVLGVVALAPEMAGQTGAVKRQLMVNRLAHRLGLQEETVWARLHELRESVRTQERGSADKDRSGAPTLSLSHAPTEGTAAEKQLLQVLLADPALVPAAAAQVPPGRIQHPGLRELLQGLYDLQAAGEPPTLDLLRVRIVNPRLADYALKMQDLGRLIADRAACLRELLAEFRRKHELEPRKHPAGRDNRPSRIHEEGFDGFENRRGPEDLARIGQAERLLDLRAGQRVPPRRRRQSGKAR